MISDLRTQAVNRYARLTAPLRAANLPRQTARLDDFRQRDKYAIIVLDALRYDYAAEILPQYFEGSLEAVWSAGHDTFEYGQRCWGDQIYEGVRYVSGATPINSEADGDTFEDDHFNELYDGWVPSETLPGLVDAWRSEWDPSLGTVPPERVVDLVAREHVDADQLVVHCFQPHAPYIGEKPLLGHTNSRDAHPNQGAPVDEPVWKAVREQRVDKRTLEAAYRANIHRACEAIQLLIEEELLGDRPVVITADHGELLADYGRDTISHPRIPFPEIRRVPWMRVDATTEAPDVDGREDATTDVKERLAALGYANGGGK